MPAVLFALLALGAPRDPAAASGLSVAAERLLDPLRERSLQPEALVDSLGLTGEETVADLGAGPGFFSLRLARRLPRGKVIATDVDAAALAYIARQAKAQGLTNVETRLVQADDPGLAPGSVDLVFACQVDHYLRDRAAYLRALRPALRRGGRLVLVNGDAYRALDQAAALTAGYVLRAERLAAPGKFVLVFGLP